VPPGPVYASIKDQEGDEIKLPNGKIVSFRPNQNRWRGNLILIAFNCRLNAKKSLPIQGKDAN
jgi:hypothetical protein